MQLHHVALESTNIQRSVEWYCKNWDASIIYQDVTWALVDLFGTKIAFVTKGEHPPHVGFNVTNDFLLKNSQGRQIRSHRDGSRFLYIEDPDGNVLEILNWDHLNESVNTS